DARLPKNVPARFHESLGSIRAGLKPRRDAPDFAGLVDRFPEAYPEAICLDRVGSRLGEILRGRARFGEVLSPDGGRGLEEHLVQDASVVRDDNQRLREAVRGVLDGHPADATLSVTVASSEESRV